MVVKGTTRPPVPEFDFKESMMRNLIGDKLQNVHGRKDQSRSTSKSKRNA